MIYNATPVLGLAVGVLDRMLQASAQKHEYKHREKMKELEMISDSSLRDQYVYQILLDKFLAPIEEAQHTVQNTAKHAQYLAEVLSYYYKDHNLSKKEARVFSSELRNLAVKITQAESLYDLKIIYEALTSFVDLAHPFQHKERKYSISREIRKNILDPLNTCVAEYQNFQRRISCYQIQEKPMIES
ncbi:MAG: hypothetical protein ACFBSC_01830 [Microcoleaceae cyanobacterium]